ncbi:MAG: helix-turn-helix transcriptional regulator [Bacillota bacterium]
MRRHGNPSRRTLEKLLTAAGSTLAEFEALRLGGSQAGQQRGATTLADPSATWGGRQLPPLPLVASSMAGEWDDAARGIELTEIHPGELVDRIPRPVSLAHDHAAYAVTIVGDSMWPRFRPGRRVAVSPKAPVAVGDDVLVKLKKAPEQKAETESVLIKELVGRSGSGLELRQFKPDLTFHVDPDEIAAIEKVVGELV